MKKYKLVETDSIKVNGKTLYRIKALKDFHCISKGAMGGYVEGEHNLSHEGNCWIYHEAKVYDDATIKDNAYVNTKAHVYGSALVHEYAGICDNARVYGSALIYGSARIYDSAHIYGETKIGDNACVKNSSHVYGNAQVCEKARVIGNSKLKDYSRAYKNACVDNSTIEGETVITDSAYINNTYVRDAFINGRMPILRKCTMSPLSFKCIYLLVAYDNIITYDCITMTVKEWKKWLKKGIQFQGFEKSDPEFKLIKKSIKFAIKYLKYKKKNK